MAIRAYVRKGCKTCRRALDLLDEEGVAYETRDLFQETPAKEELRELLRRAGLPVQEALRPLDKAYRELNLKERKHELSEEELLTLMVRHPGLIKRPILVEGDRAALGLKAEDVEAFLEDRT